MITSAHQWDPTSGVSWAALLGMVHVPMFGAHKGREAAKEAAILLDGSRASFAFLRTEDAKFAETVAPMSWSWSSCVRHTVVVIPGSDRMHLRRWYEPQITRKFAIPQQGIGVFSLLDELENAAQPRRPNVVRHVLEPFRQIRARVGANQPLLAVRVLNGLLLVAEAARKSSTRPRDVETVKTFGDAFGLLSDEDRSLCGVAGISRKTAGLNASDLVRRMVDPDPYTGCELHPTLLFRHAASKLYQEAHLEIERNPQGYLPGLEPTHEPVGASSPRDVRFTPPNLARALVQKSLEALSDCRRDLTVLDPACGSGVFLVEAIRQLNTDSVGHNRTIKAVGYDISEISEYTTRFCLEYATHDARGSRAVQTEVVKCDSLDRSWVSSDIIVMNPPFIPWERLSPEQRQKVREELGDMAQKRPDIAMAFVTKAVRSLTPGGVLGCILPASFLISETGLSWREWLSEQGSLQLLGCFEGYRYFPTSLVETAFLIYRKQSGRTRLPQSVEVLISDEGSEDAALRALRLESETVSPIKGVERFRRPLKAFFAENWRPLRQNAYKEKDSLAALALPRAGDLFEIRQGVRLGHPVFLLRDSQYKDLNRTEKHFFRPAAGGGTIRNGQLSKREYAFYPYATNGSALIKTEAELESKLPTYYSNYLAPAKDKLAARKGFENTWWELYRKRSWQVTLSPRLVSTYFGESGSFAFDDMGQYVTVNGHAWFWKKGTVVVSPDAQVPFEQTPAVWAYLAILNSKVFEYIISLFSVRLQGGQMRLERRFLAHVPLPDLTDETQTPIGVVSHLIELGKAVHAGKLKTFAPDLDQSVSLLYGLK